MKDKKPRQYRSRQGRSDRKYSDSMIAIFVGIVGVVVTLIILILK
jgi:hypothetical protein|tara:strand:- start:889 stop:1023 length:135 start_codon:yes stop_codon:yes gene_type:complete